MTPASFPVATTRAWPLFSILLGANLLAWGWAWAMFAAHPAALGAAFLAWVLGLRHAVDADHIAAIDALTRARMQRDGGAGGGAMRIGLYFSLGHSTLVFLAALGVAVAAVAMQPGIDDFRATFGPLGAGISALFLLLIGGTNLMILCRVWRDFRHLPAGAPPAPQHPHRLAGGLARLLHKVLRGATKTWHMYPLGFLFALGFDTATEISLLSIAASQSTQGVSGWQILVFPALFAAAMALVDTADTVLMVRAYGWAFVQPLRKFWYNITVTATTMMTALLIGAIEALGLLGACFQWEGVFWRNVAWLHQDLASLGLLVVGAFAVCWAISAALYRYQGMQSRPDPTTRTPHAP